MRKKKGRAFLVARASVYCRAAEDAERIRLHFLIEGGESLECIRERAANRAHQQGMRDVVFDSAQILAEYRFPLPSR